MVDNAQSINDCKIGDIFESNDQEYWNNTRNSSNGWRFGDDTQSKLFTSLEEAKKFSESLLKDKVLTVDDLVEKEIYKTRYNGNYYIFKYN